MSGASPLISGEACDEFLDSHCEESESDDCWLVGYPQGGLIQKYLRGDVAIAFRRAESPSGETEQNGFIIQMKKAGFNRAGSVCLNSRLSAAKWISAMVMLQPGLAAAQ
jgi:hypothetical protein